MLIFYDYWLSFLTKGQLVAGNTKAWISTDTIKEVSFSDHFHNEYAPVNHTHDQYLTEDDVNKIPSVVQVGTIINTVQKSPAGYLECNGQIISAEEYPELCSHLQPSYTYYDSKNVEFLPDEFKSYPQENILITDSKCIVYAGNSLYVADRESMSDYSAYTEIAAGTYVSKVNDSGNFAISSGISKIAYSKELNMYAIYLWYNLYMQSTATNKILFTYDLNTIISNYSPSGVGSVLFGFQGFNGNYIHCIQKADTIIYGSCSNTSSAEYIQYGRVILNGLNDYLICNAISFVSNNKVVFISIGVARYQNNITTTMCVTTPNQYGNNKGWSGFLSSFSYTPNNLFFKYCNDRVFLFTGKSSNTIDYCYVLKYNSSNSTLTYITTINLYGMESIELISAESESKILLISRNSSITTTDIYDVITDSFIDTTTVSTADYSTITDFSALNYHGNSEYVSAYSTGYYNNTRFISPIAHIYQVPNIASDDSRIKIFIKT